MKKKLIKIIAAIVWVVATVLLYFLETKRLEKKILINLEDEA